MLRWDSDFAIRISLLFDLENIFEIFVDTHGLRWDGEFATRISLLLLLENISDIFVDTLVKVGQ